jgi:hypothetical protein
MVAGGILGAGPVTTCCILLELEKLSPEQAFAEKVRVEALKRYQKLSLRWFQMPALCSTALLIIFASMLSPNKMPIDEAM